MYRGLFKFKNSNGTPQTYKKGDVVTSQGRLFLCKRLTTQSPLQDKSSWQTTGLIEPFQGQNPPINPIENQLWINGSGKMYIWYKDNDGFQWIEV